MLLSEKVALVAAMAKLNEIEAEARCNGLVSLSNKLSKIVRSVMDVVNGKE